MNKLILFVAAAIIVSSCGQNGDKSITAGIEHYRAEEFDLAMAEYRKGLGMDLAIYKIEEVYTYIGMVHHDLEAYDSAIYYYKKAVEINPDFIDPWVDMGVSYRLIGEYDLAAESYSKAMELDPNDTELLVSLGALYVVKEEPVKAIEHLEKAIELDPSILSGHSNYAIALAMDGRFNEANIQVQFAEEHGYEHTEALKERIAEIKIEYDYEQLGFENNEVEE